MADMGVVTNNSDRGPPLLTHPPWLPIDSTVQLHSSCNAQGLHGKPSWHPSLSPVFAQAVPSAWNTVSMAGSSSFSISRLAIVSPPHRGLWAKVILCHCYLCSFPSLTSVFEITLIISLFPAYCLPPPPDLGPLEGMVLTVQHRVRHTVGTQ